MNVVNVNGDFSEKWLDLCTHVYNFYFNEYKKAIDKKDYNAEKKLYPYVAGTKAALDLAWEKYNEKIGDSVDWKKVYKEGE